MLSLLFQPLAKVVGGSLRDVKFFALGEQACVSKLRCTKVCKFPRSHEVALLPFALRAHVEQARLAAWANATPPAAAAESANNIHES